MASWYTRLWECVEGNPEGEEAFKEMYQEGLYLRESLETAIKAADDWYDESRGGPMPGRQWQKMRKLCSRAEWKRFSIKP